MRPTPEEWALFEGLPWPAHLYKHRCALGGFTVMGRECFGDGSWVDHKHYAQTAGAAIRLAHAATTFNKPRVLRHGGGSRATR